MSAAALAHYPLMAGGALLAATGNVIHWGFARFMRAPLANAGILAMVTLSAMASSNALYLQRNEHPAPMFVPAGTAFAPRQAAIAPVIPATRTKKATATIAPLPSAETTGSVPAVEKAIGNDEVGEIQRKLTSMQIFDGAVDGLYGPRTARAIRTFEERLGLPVKGELTRAVLEAIRKAPVILPEPQVEALPTPEPLPEAKKTRLVVPAEAEASSEALPAVDTTTTPVTVTDLPAASNEPLPAPAPLELAPAADEAVLEDKPRALRRELPATPEAAIDLAVETAGDAIDTIISGVQTMAMTKPGKTVETAEVQQLAEAKPAAEASPAVEVSAVSEANAVAEVAAQPVVRAEPRIELASVAEPKVGVTLALPDEQATVPADVAELDTEATPEDLAAFSATDPVVVAKVQRALGSLGFLHGPADGIAGEATSKAIRNFEVYYNYDVTGRISPDLLDLLVERGATF